MRITRIETIPIRVPLKPEFAIRSARGGDHAVSPFLIVKVHTDHDWVGLGEVSCTPRWSGEDQFTAAHLIHAYLEPLLTGESPLDVPGLAARFNRAFAANYFTKAGVEMALWDLAGKASGKPVHTLLGPVVRAAIPTKWSVSGVAPAAAAKIARWAVAAGFTALKVKVGIDPQEDRARVAAVRRAAGPAVKLGVDANGGWSVEEAVQALADLEAFDIQFAEQPVSPEDPTLLAAVRKAVNVPVMADESVCTLGDARVLHQMRAADALSVYVGKAGGIGPARDIARFARAAGMKCTLGSNLELDVGSAAMAHLAVATAEIDAEEFPCDIIGPLYYQDRIVRNPLPISPGSARCHERPGLGVDLDDDKIALYRSP